MRKLSSILLILVLILSACEGAEGPAGPVGPEGPAGPPGEPGQLEATVYTYTIREADFQSDASDDTAIYAAPAITDDVIRGGIVLSFMNLGGSAWIAMPFVLPVEDIVANMTFAVAPGEYMIMLVRNVSTPLISAYEGDRVRVVVIEPGSILTGKRAVDLTDYEAVARAYGL